MRDGVIAALHNVLAENPSDDLARTALADRFEEIGYYDWAASQREMLAIKSRIRGYDWEEAFKYAAEPDVPPGSKVAAAGFTRQDVAEVIACEDGKNDEESWVGLFLLKDGRFAYLTAHCDYTGWG